LIVTKCLLKRANELAAAVRAFDLSITKQVSGGKQTVAQHFEARTITFAPIVTVGELEAIDVPLPR
jgi:hypothetical protein